MTVPLSTTRSRLRELIAAAPAVAVDGPAEAERCELCGAPVADRHRHVIDLEARRLCCVCQPCAILFDRPAAGGTHYQLVPERRFNLTGFQLDDATWAGLRLPVEVAFFFHDSAVGRVVAFYPSPAGAVESLLDLPAWDRIVADNPVLTQLAPDVEALLVNRSRGARDHLLTPIADCYTLVGLMRTGWQGLSGGSQVWQAITGFFDELRSTAKPAPVPHRTEGGEQWPRSTGTSATS